jgi:hypothetical protein
MQVANETSELSFEMKPETYTGKLTFNCKTVLLFARAGGANPGSFI